MAHTAQLTRLYVVTFRFVANDRTRAEHAGKTVVSPGHLTDRETNTISDGDEQSNVAKSAASHSPVAAPFSPPTAWVTAVDDGLVMTPLVFVMDSPKYMLNSSL